MASLYIDENVARAVTVATVAVGHDVVFSRDIGMRSAWDDLHLLTAARLGRILVTSDADFLLLHSAWRRWSAEWGVSPQHAGILVTPQPPACPVARGAQALLDFLARGIVVTNELWHWTEADGWRQFPSP